MALIDPFRRFHRLSGGPAPDRKAWRSGYPRTPRSRASGGGCTPTARDGKVPVVEWLLLPVVLRSRFPDSSMVLVYAGAATPGFVHGGDTSGSRVWPRAKRMPCRTCHGRSGLSCRSLYAAPSAPPRALSKFLVLGVAAAGGDSGRGTSQGVWLGTIVGAGRQ